jgi:hypothetical protein
MTGGVLPVDSTPVTAINIGGKLTLSIIITCIVAASGGLLYGYDLGVSGFFFFCFYSINFPVYLSSLKDYLSNFTFFSFSLY